MTLLMLLAMLLVFCLFYKIIIYYSIKCVTEPPVKVMVLGNFKWLIKHIVNNKALDMGNSNKREPFPGHNRLIYRCPRGICLLLAGSSPIIVHLSDLPTKSSPELEMRFSSTEGQVGHKTMVEIKTETKGTVK